MRITIQCLYIEYTNDRWCFNAIALQQSCVIKHPRDRPSPLPNRVEIIGAVVLPEHIHFLWRLPPNDSDYSQRVSRLKVLFTRSLRGYRALPQTVSASRRKHRESDVWQRQFWEHTSRDDVDLQRHLDYLHYNPVKHGLVVCPHLWEFSSFNKWVEQGRYRPDWGCVCGGRQPEMLDFEAMAGLMGE